MTPLDRLIQRARITKARPYIHAGCRLLDIGCSSDGILFELLGDRIVGGIGIDPELRAPIERNGYRLLPGSFPQDLPDVEPFDVITMLAVLEHIPDHEQGNVATSCANLLRPLGYLIITVPSPIVDHILHALAKLRLIHGMELHQHHHFAASKTPALFVPCGLKLHKWSKFQFGLNNLFVFQRPLESVQV
jgi:2-polyprenyl-3-methyl-5-hydroxy-6-metoxy-1,4-benzoquinol methylase